MAGKRKEPTKTVSKKISNTITEKGKYDILTESSEINK